MPELPIRKPAVAGTWYPDDPVKLRETVQSHLEEASLPDTLGIVKAIVAPHAGYIYSGPVAGYAFKTLLSLPKKARTVYLMGPSHRVHFQGVALGQYSAFRTPLGDVPVATELVEDMIKRSSLYTHAALAHVPEHSLEIEVPFLQVTLADFCLVPMLLREVDPRIVGQDLAEHINADDLIVVSSDLSHFHAYDQAREIDQALLDAVLKDEEKNVLRGEACGREPLAALMEIARLKEWRPHLLDYRTSGDTAGSKWEVVGYAALAYTQP
jgi:AmmeMemoRadiSam system protein B